MPTTRIKEIHDRSRGTYSSPRACAALQAEGIRIGKRRAHGLMKAAGLKSAGRRKRPSTTTRDDSRRPSLDLVDRDFTAEEPDELGGGDITYVPADRGYLYLSVVLDAFSRRVVGWAMADPLRTALVLGPLNMASQQRNSDETIHHSDQGSQYTAIGLGKCSEEAGERSSMGSAGDCYENVMCESFFATLECELIDRARFATKSEARLPVFEFIEGWYNPDRLHSGLGYRSPHRYEEEYHSRDHSHSEEPHSPVAA